MLKWHGESVNYPQYVPMLLKQEALQKILLLEQGLRFFMPTGEGAIKNIATYYLEYVAMLGLPYGQLKPNFLAITLKNDLKSFELSNKTTIHTTVVAEIIQSDSVKSKIPIEGIVKTNSNLNSEIFVEIMATIGLDCTDYESSYKLIDTVLLEKRNKIAHGERLETIGMDEERYFEIHEKVFALIQLFANQVANAAILKEYLR